MSDRRPSKLYKPADALYWWRSKGKKMPIVELYEAVVNPVAAVRRGVESGTIEGEVVWLCSEHGRIGHRNACDGRARVEACPMVETLVIPDGGSET